MVKYVFSAAIAGMLMVSGCQSKSGGNAEARVIQQNIGRVNPYLWRASLDTMSFMPLTSADPFGGVIVTDWYVPPESQNERLKVQVYILDRQLRADGLRVTVFRQVRSGYGGWTGADVKPETAAQLENAILTRARQLRIDSGAEL